MVFICHLKRNLIYFIDQAIQKLHFCLTKLKAKVLFLETSL